MPIPKVHDLSVLNERLLARCLERLDTLEEGDRAAALLADLDALRDLPAVPFEASGSATGGRWCLERTIRSCAISTMPGLRPCMRSKAVPSTT